MAKLGGFPLQSHPLIALAFERGAAARMSAKKMGTYFEMGTNGHRFVCFQIGISLLRRHLRRVSIQLLVRPTCSNGGVSLLA